MAKDRTRDLEIEDSARIIEWMKKRQAKASFIKMISEKVDMAVKEKNAQFGERLPAGLVLR